MNDAVSGKSTYLAPASLTPYEKNSRKHSDAQVKLIAASIKEFGFVKPVICDENRMLLAGHGAVLAATELGLDRIPVRVISGLTDAQKRAYVIADNRTSELSTWDWELLKVELDELKALDFDLQPVGFGDMKGVKTHDRKGSTVTIGDDRFLLQLEFATEKEMERVYEEMTQRGIECAILT